MRVGLPAKRRKPNALPNCQTLILPDKRTHEWDVEGTLTSNYQAAGFVLDPNGALPPRVSPGTPSTPQPAESEDQEEEDEPEELRVMLGKQRKERAEAPRVERLTKMQRAHVGTLLAEHGLQFQAMARDMKLNKLQHTAGALKFLCVRYLAYEPCPPNITPEEKKQLTGRGSLPVLAEEQ